MACYQAVAKPGFQFRRGQIKNKIEIKKFNRLIKSINLNM